jgi:hypothetical protein
LKPYLLARFAWAVLLRDKPFITAGLERVVVEAVTKEDGGPSWEVNTRTGTYLFSKYAGEGSKGATPRKRKLGVSSAADDEAEEGEEEENDGYIGILLERRKQ